MGRLRNWLLGGVLTLLMVWIGAGSITNAQSRQPYVVFVEEYSTLRMASLTDPGPDGLTRLAETFREYGARTGFLPLDRALPDDVAVLVLVRPRAPLPGAFLARIYEAMSRGVNVLIALDPARHMGANPDGARSGLNGLLGGDYGIGLQDVFLVEPNFTANSVTRLETSFSLAHASTVSNPVIEPLLRYQIPVQLWGARSLDVSALTITSEGFPLIAANPYYGESDLAFFATPTLEGAATATPQPTPANGRPLPTPIPRGYQIDLDLRGQLNVGALGINMANGSRVAVLTDGELPENDYGLALSRQDGLALHVGNRILIDRLAGWLLGVDPESYLPLPAGFVYISIDGQPEDWAASLISVPDPVGDSSLVGYDMADMTAFRDSHYLYVRVGTGTDETLKPATQLILTLETNADGTPAVQIRADASGVMIDRGGERQPVLDGAASVGTVLEARIPLRETGEVNMLPQVCLQPNMSMAFPAAPDCSDSPVPVIQRAQLDPAPLLLPADMLAVPRTSGTVNIRSAPDQTLDNILFRAGDREIFRVLGRNADGTWLEVENARVHGWITASLTQTNGDVSLLPVTDGSPVGEPETAPIEETPAAESATEEAAPGG
ncbi:MAG: hypothetical protein U0670_04230 [Anaerolineae bacterium]